MTRQPARLFPPMIVSFKLDQALKAAPEAITRICGEGWDGGVVKDLGKQPDLRAQESLCSE